MTAHNIKHFIKNIINGIILKNNKRHQMQVFKSAQSLESRPCDQSLLNLIFTLGIIYLRPNDKGSHLEGTVDLL